MSKKQLKKLLLALCIVLCLTVGWSLAEETADHQDVKMAVDISDSCLYNGFKLTKIHDNAYNTHWEFPMAHYERSMTITSQSELIGGVLLKWKSDPIALNVQVPGPGKDEWVTVAECEAKYFAQYYPVDGEPVIRMVPRDNPKEIVDLCEVTVMSQGQLPEDFQLWRDPPEKVDMMLLHGHPDDELLWFGGMIPYYGTELGKNLLVCCCSPVSSARRLELLDALWACGIRIYPALGIYEDRSMHDMKAIFDHWGGEDQLLAFVNDLFRRYRPDVVVTQDVNGEYGHGVHKAISYIVRKAIDTAMDPTFLPDSAAAYGTWEVPKVYIHLYPEAQIKLDWNKPMAAFGGKTGYEVAAEAFLFHRSQQNRGWSIKEGGEYDNTIFGLYRTSVGPDVKGGDLFENIP